MFAQCRTVTIVKYSSFSLDFGALSPSMYILIYSKGSRNSMQPLIMARSCDVQGSAFSIATTGKRVKSSDKLSHILTIYDSSQAITMGLVSSRDATPVGTPQASGRTSPVRLTVPQSPHVTPQHSPLNSPALTHQYDSSTGSLKRITQKFTFEWNKFC